MNFLISAGTLVSSIAGQVAHTASSVIFKRDDASRFYQHLFDYFLVSAAHWPEYFDKNGLVEPKCAYRVPYSLAMYLPDKTLYEIHDARPKICKPINKT